MTRSLMLITAALVVSSHPALADSCSSGHAKSAGTHAHAYDHASADIVDTAIQAGMFNTLVTAVEAAGLVETLKGEGPFTVFAPTDEAFARLPEGTVEALLADRAKLAEVLTYHVVAGKVKASDVVSLDWAATVQGQSVRVTTAGDHVMVDGAKVVKTDIKTSNGIIHVIDAVIMPRQDIVETAAGAGSFGTLVSAVEAAGLVETLKAEGPFTVFAPTDAAFSKLPEGTLDALLAEPTRLQSVLTYHVVPGRVLASDLAAKGARQFTVTTAQGQELEVSVRDDGSVVVDGARVTKTDIIAGNGVIHVIDAVVVPGSTS
jgi:uncharacterized surface protein with fasciclin (FAS1) repeats